VSSSAPGLFPREALAIVGLALAAAFVSDATARRERRLAWFGKPPSAISDRPPSPRPLPGSGAAPAAGAAAARFAPHPDRPFVEIAPEQAKALFDRGALFLDARRTDIFREGHIRGAQSIAVWESDADDKVNALVLSGRDTKAPIVAYCSGGDCEDSHQLAQKLWGVTFDNVYVYRDGFPDWRKRGWPVSAGEGK
jgi:rhodanese-related sulfurtransferase